MGEKGTKKGTGGQGTRRNLTFGFWILDFGGWLLIVGN